MGARSTVDTFLDHVEHAAQLIGADHVGLGFDFLADTEAHTLPASAQPEPGFFIEGLQRPADLPTFGARLEQRLGQADAHAVAGGTLIGALERLLPA